MKPGQQNQLHISCSAQGCNNKIRITRKQHKVGVRAVCSGCVTKARLAQEEEQRALEAPSHG